MLKKIILTVILLAMTAVFAVGVFSRRAPQLLVSAIERALNKKVKIHSIEYSFPGHFELQGFEVREGAPFEGENSFSVDAVKLDVSPLSLSQKKLIIDRVEVDNADITIIKYRGKLIHSLSSASRKPGGSSALMAQNAPGSSAAAPTLPLEIRDFILNNSNFQFIDYDAQEGGFVIVLDQIHAQIKDVVLPFSSRHTSYGLKARLLQGRDQRSAAAELTGRTAFGSMDTDANLGIQGVYLPYFRPYYGQVTQAAIDSGYLDGRANLRVDKKDLVLNVDLEIMGLLFQSYEAENQLFGLRAEEILSFLKDSSGKLKFKFTARWNIADRTVKAKDVIRKSIERSLKNTVLGNVGNIVQNVIQKIGEGGIGGAKKEVEGTLKKIKDLFKY